jgi:hypothetical protein
VIQDRAAVGRGCEYGILPLARFLLEAGECDPPLCRRCRGSNLDHMVMAEASYEQFNLLLGMTEEHEF